MTQGAQSEQLDDQRAPRAKRTVHGQKAENKEPTDSSQRMHPKLDHKSQRQAQKDENENQEAKKPQANTATLDRIHRTRPRIYKRWEAGFRN
jgi:hypothetical protein